MKMLFIIAQFLANSPGEAVQLFGIIDYKRTGSSIKLIKNYLVCRLMVIICALVVLIALVAIGIFLESHNYIFFTRACKLLSCTNSKFSLV
jgi:hypothetical protein